MGNIVLTPNPRLKDVEVGDVKPDVGGPHHVKDVEVGDVKPDVEVVDVKPDVAIKLMVFDEVSSGFRDLRQGWEVFSERVFPSVGIFKGFPYSPGSIGKYPKILIQRNPI